MKLFNKSMLPMVVLLSLTSANVYASKVHIKNEDTADVNIIIEAGEGHAPMVGNKQSIELTLQPGEEREVSVSKQVLGNVDIFSITGKVKMPSLYNKCFPLYMNKDYKVSFIGGKVGGTICVSQQLTKD